MPAAPREETIRVMRPRPRAYAVAVLVALASPAALPAHPGVGIVVGEGGDVYFVHGPSSRVFRIDDKGNHSVHVSAEGGRGPAVPHHLALMPDGSLITASDKGGEVWRIAKDGAARRIELPARCEAAAGLGAGGDPLAASSEGVLFGIDADTDSSALVRIGKDGACMRLAGGARGHQDGRGEAARFGELHGAGFTLDREGRLILSDDGRWIRRVDMAGQVTTLAGGAERAVVDGPAERARFGYAMGVAVAADGTIYIADAEGRRIRRLSTGGEVTTLAGDGERGGDDGPATTASFDTPAGVAVDAKGHVYVLDWFGVRDGVRVRRITPDGQVSTLAAVH